MTSKPSSIRRLFGLLTLVALFACLESFPLFQLQIPNGNRVPHPCNRTIVWQGVGHENSSGSGPRNAFGQAFAAAGYKWTTDLCRQDSDGDGRTNGEELGDPDCTWNMVSTPQVTDYDKLSHPGICEPLSSSECFEKNKFLWKNEHCNSLKVQKELEQKQEQQRQEEEEKQRQEQQEQQRLLEQQKLEQQSLQEQTPESRMLGDQPQLQADQLNVVPNVEATIPEAVALPPIPAPLPSDVLVYDGALEDVLKSASSAANNFPIEGQQQPAYASFPAQLMLSEPALFQTVTVTYDNQTVAVQLPLISPGLTNVDEAQAMLMPTTETPYFDENVAAAQRAMVQQQQSTQDRYAADASMASRPQEMATNYQPAAPQSPYPFATAIDRTEVYQLPTVYQPAGSNIGENALFRYLNQPGAGYPPGAQPIVQMPIVPAGPLVPPPPPRVHETVVVAPPPKPPVVIAPPPVLYPPPRIAPRQWVYRGAATSTQCLDARTSAAVASIIACLVVFGLN